MEIRSFGELMVIDKELASLFLRPEEAVNWIHAVEGDIKEWVGKHNKQYWEVVRFVCQKRGILGKISDDKKTIKLARKDFAELLLKFCPRAFSEDETVDALKSSMAHFKFNDELKRLDKVLDCHLIRIHIKDVEDMLDRKPTEVPAEPTKPTLVDLVEEYLRAHADEDGWPRSIVCVRPQYDGASPALSIETYQSEKFLTEHHPSRIDAYEFVDGVLSKSKLNEFIGQYCDMRDVKLYVVSSAGLLPDVRFLAIDKRIGYVMLNPAQKMTSESYVLPRSIEDFAIRQHNWEMLTGAKPMTALMLIMDGGWVTSSLADVLSDKGVAIKKHCLLDIPYLTEEEIEERADTFTCNDVEARIHMLEKLGIMNVDLSIDPFDYAESQGLSHDVQALDEETQLGRLNVKENHVTLNASGMDNFNRFRFTMAHEFGHYVLHAPLFREQGVVSVGESESTLSVSKGNSRRIEYQANKFASYLLMPKVLVMALYAVYFDKYVHQVYGDFYHALYYNEKQRETWSSYNNVVGNMSRLLGVSREALNIRLTTLGLLNIGS